MEKGKKRLATLVGCNYANTRNELYGCINDVLAMREVLISRFGFEPTNIQFLTDQPGSPVVPTGANILQALNKMIDQAEDGDVLYFHYSGHGTRIPKPGHASLKDEAIVPCDFNLITDVDFRKLVNRLPKGASFTILSDSCHSGGLIDKEKEQIGPSAAKKPSNNDHKTRAIPYESVLQHLSSISGIESTDIGSHLCQAFGEEASSKFRLQAPHEHNLLGSAVHPDAGILLSGCQANETSADMSASTETEGKAFGAFSYAVQLVLKAHSSALSYRDIVTQARKNLFEQGFEQHPCLYCSDENANQPFLWQPEQPSKEKA
ncbi:metacaspase-9 [Telopea speciosissima]|uniref:metacaspase-9 n=1 Tax=Telopea speciosissima TaxID=54955 RepID=UPI001CC750FA|nr:metacaspase-9 [Telopea speciosissima]